MGFFDIFKRKKKQDEILNYLYNEHELTMKTETVFPENINLPKGEIVSFDDEVLDTNSPEAILKLKHNLDVLIKRTKEKGKIDKFMLIREDDFFPDEWKWQVLSHNTNLEKVYISLSSEVRKVYALEQSGITPYTEVMGTTVTNASSKQIYEALAKIDNKIGTVLLPSRFRSTKHYTINTPLGVTGDYNSVSANRDYIIIDDINNFLASGYAYSVSYHDAYLDISHEGLPISQNAVVLINDEKYDRIIQDPKIASQLAQRKVVRFKGDEVIAINMVLTEMGVLPSKIGSWYAHYDNEIYDILNKSIKELADANDLYFDKSHGGALTPEGGHFSNYYDDKNKDYQVAFDEFIEFMKQKFPEQKELFTLSRMTKYDQSQDIVEKLGSKRILDAIKEYNNFVSKRLEKQLYQYKQDRGSITPEIHQQFVETITLINDYYKSYRETDKDIESAIQIFLQGDTVVQQLNAEKRVRELLQERGITVEDLKTAYKEQTITSNDLMQAYQTISNIKEEKSKQQENETPDIGVESK